MAKVLDIARTIGYKAALDFVVDNYPHLATYLLSEVRIDWLFHCYDEGHTNCCLDLGSGWGGLSFPLAKLFEEVVSLERVPARLEFQKIRAAEDDARSVRLIAGDVASLPLRENYFDLVVANGVLEWVPLLREGDQRSAQVRFLQEVKRSLKPGGCLYIGTENRFGLQFWLGARDHTSLPFTSLLPRRIADIVVSAFLRDKGWVKYYTYTYSVSGYKALLREAGFGPVDFYWTYPSYSYPKFAGKLHDGSTYSFLARYHYENHKEMSFYKRLASFVGMLMPKAILSRICPVIWPNFLIFTWKDFRPQTIEDDILRITHAKSLVRMSGSDCPASKICFIGLENDKLRSFSKLLRYQNGNLEREEILLKQHARVSFEKRKLRSRTLFGEKPIVGRPCSYVSLKDAQRAIEWLLRFQDRTRGKPLTEADLLNEQTEIRYSLQRLEATSIASEEIDETMEQTQRLMRLLNMGNVTTCSEHGDFCPGNILLSKAGEVFVFDWEFYRVSGNPLFDFCFFLISSSSRQKMEKSFLHNMSGRGPCSGVIADIVQTYLQHKGLPTEAVLLGIPYVLSRCVARYSVYSATRSPKGHEYRRMLTVWNKSLRYADFTWLDKKQANARKTFAGAG